MINILIIIEIHVFDVIVRTSTMIKTVHFNLCVKMDTLQCTDLENNKTNQTKE